ncbi:MAG: redoxin family protein [Bryobacteraceae bacterium]
MTVTKAVINQPLPDALFEFKPPAGAVQVDEFTNGPLSPLAGKSLPDFELKDTQGNSITPASLKGKLAILGFSQRVGAQDAFLEILYRAFKDRGVAVVYVVSRNVDDLGAQISRLGYTMPAAVAPPSMTAESMGFTIPHRLDGLIVVDKAGKVIYVASSASPNQTVPQIVKALHDNGIW